MEANSNIPSTANRVWCPACEQPTTAHHCDDYLICDECDYSMDLTHALIDAMVTVTFCGHRFKHLMLEGQQGIVALVPTDGESDPVWADVIDEITCVECHNELLVARASA